MTGRVYGTCPYCDRPARSSGACWMHEELLAGEPDALARELEREAELVDDPQPEPPKRRRRSPRR